MKKLIQTIMAILIGMILLPALASAQTITNGNGTGATNTITQNNSTTCNASNTNTIDAVINNSQSGSSGSAGASGNTTVGNVTSGSASNSSSTSTNVSASNGSCLPSATTVTNPPTPTPFNQPGGDVQSGAVLASDTEIQALPSTGETTQIQWILITTATISGLLFSTRLARNFLKEPLL